MEQFFWQIIAGVGTVVLLLVGLVIRLLWPELIKSFWQRIFKPQPAATNGNGHEPLWCIQKHKNIDERIGRLEGTEQSNIGVFSKMIEDLKKNNESALDGMRAIGQKQLETVLPMKEDIGKIKGKLGIP